ncbi:MAG TPA: hypothetical protein VGK30_08535, partial [Candidatus Binatia bacterium]
GERRERERGDESRQCPHVRPPLPREVPEHLGSTAPAARVVSPTTLCGHPAVTITPSRYP